MDTITTPAVRERAIDMTKSNIEKLRSIWTSDAAAPDVKDAANKGLKFIYNKPDIAPELSEAAGAAISQ